MNKKVLPAILLVLIMIIVMLIVVIHPSNTASDPDGAPTSEISTDAEPGTSDEAGAENNPDADGNAFTPLEVQDEVTLEIDEGLSTALG